MAWREERTQKILKELKISGGIPDQYLEAYQSGQIKDGDSVLMLLIDEEWYQKKYVIPRGIIPGPKKPKNLNSFLFPGLHHLCAIKTEGLVIWNGAQQVSFTSHPFLFIATADGPGMAFLTGLVGHRSKMGCHLYCGLPGWHKPGGLTYYPALLWPDRTDSHPDIPIDELPAVGSFDYKTNLQHIIQCRNMAKYEQTWLETGITKPSIFCGFDTDHILLVPLCFSSDIMHVATINIGDLLIPLWRGTFRVDPMDNKFTWDWAVLTKDAWKAHGSIITSTTPFLLGSFDRPPHKPAEKINSGYKA
ncbi:hypothetical protein BDR05DRAFT_974967 [Suillus weaverae]|nr:hypothetical protein BDR05DRAFT_974967 [Suillus weaverae]